MDSGLLLVKLLEAQGQAASAKMAKGLLPSAPPATTGADAGAVPPLNDPQEGNFTAPAVGKLTVRALRGMTEAEVNARLAEVRTYAESL